MKAGLVNVKRKILSSIGQNGGEGSRGSDSGRGIWARSGSWHLGAQHAYRLKRMMADGADEDDEVGGLVIASAVVATVGEVSSFAPDRSSPPTSASGHTAVERRWKRPCAPRLTNTFH
jgi:hypothetical protein